MVIDDPKLREALAEMEKKFSAEKVELHRKFKEALEQTGTSVTPTNPMSEKPAEEKTASELISRLKDQILRLEAENDALKAENLEIRRSRKIELENLEKKHEIDLAKAADTFKGDIKNFTELLNEERLRWRETLQSSTNEPSEGNHVGDQ